MNFQQADTLNEAIRAIGIRHRALCVAALAPFGIHPGHKLLLLELEAEGPRTQAELAAASGYEAPTITLSVRQLEAAGLVVRRPSPTDGRATIVELKTAWRLVAEQTVNGLSSASLGHLTEVLSNLAASLATTVPPSKDVPRYVPRSIRGRR